MDLDTCRVIFKNRKTLSSTSVEQSLGYLTAFNNIDHVEIYAIDSNDKSLTHYYTFSSVEESIESLMNI
jgi:hypothetical protein